MARKQEVQYVRYYTAGTAAAKALRQPERRRSRTRLVNAPVIRISIDPVAVLGSILACVLLVCMLVGILRMYDENRQIAQANIAIATLNRENAELTEQYHSSIDLESVKTAADSMGLVPRDQVRHITVSVPEPVPEEEPGWWDSFVAEVRELFAYCR